MLKDRWSAAAGPFAASLLIWRIEIRAVAWLDGAPGHAGRRVLDGQARPAFVNADSGRKNNEL
jgi:hypothetical protein